MGFCPFNTLIISVSEENVNAFSACSYKNFPLVCKNCRGGFIHPNVDCKICLVFQSFQIHRVVAVFKLLVLMAEFRKHLVEKLCVLDGYKHSVVPLAL